jgi:hypothetical protein
MKAALAVVSCAAYRKSGCDAGDAISGRASIRAANPLDVYPKAISISPY